MLSLTIPLGVQVVAYVVVRRLAYFVPSGMLPSLATLSGRGSFVPDNLGDPALVDGDVFYDPARNPDINPEPYTGLDGPGAAGRGAGAAGEPEWRSAKDVMAEQAQRAARDAGKRDTEGQTAGAGPSAAPAHGADAMQHGEPAGTGGPGAAMQTADDREAAAQQPEAGAVAEPAADPAARMPPHEPPALLPPPQLPPAAPAAGVHDPSASGTAHDERSDSAAQAATAAVAEHPMADPVQAAAQTAGIEAGPAVGDDHFGSDIAAGTEPIMAPAGGDSEAPETAGPAEGAAVGSMSGAGASSAAPAAEQADGGNAGVAQSAADGGGAGSPVSSDAEAWERSRRQAAPAVTPPGAERTSQQPAAGEASPAHAAGGEPDPEPDPAAADSVGECSADSAGTCAAPLGTADPADGSASPEHGPESGLSEPAAASAHGGGSDAAAASAARPGGDDGAPDALGMSTAAAEAVPAGAGPLADTGTDDVGAHAPGEAAAAGPSDAHLGGGAREPSMEPRAEHASAAADPPSADAAPVSEDAAAAAATRGSEGDSAAHAPADEGPSAGAPPVTQAEAGAVVSEQADMAPALGELRAATGSAAGHALADDAKGASDAALHEPAGGRDPGFLSADAPALAGASGRGAGSMGSSPTDTESLRASHAGGGPEAGSEDWTGGPAAKGVAGSEESGEREAEGLGGLVGGTGTGELPTSGAAGRMPAAAGAEGRLDARPAAAHEGSTHDMPADEPMLRDEL